MTDDELLAQFRGMKDELRTEMRDFKGELRAEMHELRTEMRSTNEQLKLHIDTVETNLLTAFHGWASPMEMRQRGLKNVVSDFDDRLVLIEERVRKLEAGAAGIA